MCGFEKLPKDNLEPKKRKKTMSVLDADMDNYNSLKLNEQSIDEYESESVDPRLQVKRLGIFS